MPLGHVDRILENVNRGVAAENCPSLYALAAPIPQPVKRPALNQIDAASDSRSENRRGMIGFRLIRQSSTVPIVRFHFERIRKKEEKISGRLPMAEVNKTQQTGSGMTDTNELQSTRTDAPQTAGAIAGEYRGKAERTLDDARDRVRTFREDADQHVRENPTKAVFTALGIGFILGLIFRR